MSFAPLLPIGLVVVLGLAAAAWVLWTRPAGPVRGPTVRHLAMVAVAVVLVLRPGETSAAERRTQLLDVDVVFAVDVTTSMAAEDYDGDEPRFRGVRADVDDLLDEAHGARFSLVTFGADAIVELPFTTDATAVSTVVDTLRAEPYLVAAGSQIERPVELLESVLESAEDADPDRARVLVLLTDGEEVGESGGSGLGSYGDLADLVDTAVVLGYGTEDGGRMREGRADAEREGDYVRDSRGDIAISRIDEANLSDIADDLGGEYLHRTRPGGLSGLIDPGAVDLDVAEDTATARTDIVWLPGIGLGLLVLWELWALTLAGRETRLWWAR